MPGKNGEKIRCSFCNKTEDQVRKLIAGPSGVYICDECVEICSEIIEEELEDEYTAEDDQEINLLKPAQIKEFLDEYVIGQDEAKKAQEAARAAFSGGGTDISAMPTTPFEAAKLAGEGMGVVNFIKELGLVPSNREGFMTIEQGGLKIDGEKVTDKKLQITADSFKDGKMLVEKGKKKKVVVELV